jgi:hypothetical protein
MQNDWARRQHRVGNYDLLPKKTGIRLFYWLAAQSLRRKSGLNHSFAILKRSLYFLYFDIRHVVAPSLSQVIDDVGNFKIS